VSEILDKSGKPIEKKWDAMTLDEKLDVLRMGIGALINQGNAMGVAMGRLMKALDEQEQQGEPTEAEEGPQCSAFGGGGDEQMITPFPKPVKSGEVPSE